MLSYTKDLKTKPPTTYNNGKTNLFWTTQPTRQRNTRHQRLLQRHDTRTSITNNLPTNTRQRKIQRPRRNVLRNEHRQIITKRNASPRSNDKTNTKPRLQHQNPTTQNRPTPLPKTIPNQKHRIL